MIVAHGGFQDSFIKIAHSCFLKRHKMSFCYFTLHNTSICFGLFNSCINYFVFKTIAYNKINCKKEVITKNLQLYMKLCIVNKSKKYKI